VRVKILLLLSLLYATVCPLRSYSMEVKLAAQELADQADVIVAAEVVGQGTFIRDDENGKHIYTEVTLRPSLALKGMTIDPKDAPADIKIEIIGGTFGGGERK